MLFPDKYGPSGTIEQSYLDSRYRQLASELIDYSSFIEIISRDLTCIAYPEIEYSLFQARKDGAAVLIYAKSADSRIVERLRELDCQLYVKEHELDIADHIISDATIVLTTRMLNSARIGDWKFDKDYAETLLDKNEELYRGVAPIITTNKPLKEYRDFCRKVQPLIEPSQDVVRKRRKRYEELVKKVSSYGKAKIDLDEFIQSLRSREIYDEP